MASQRAVGGSNPAIEQMSEKFPLTLDRTRTVAGEHYAVEQIASRGRGANGQPPEMTSPDIFARVNIDSHDQLMPHIRRHRRSLPD